MVSCIFPPDASHMLLLVKSSLAEGKPELEEARSKINATTLTPFYF